jgi:hypothetical protein
VKKSLITGAKKFKTRVLTQRKEFGFELDGYETL